MVLKFGLFLNKQYLPGDSPGARFAEHVEQVRLARDLGFDSVLFGQHFLSAPFQELQPVPLLARLAAESGDMRLGLCILLGALLPPVEVAEVGATLDVITGGRFICGLGLGYRAVEYDAFGVPYRERVRRFEDNLRLICRLWTEETVTYDGPHCKLDAVSLVLRPIQKPRPPLWIAANSDPAVRRAAALGDSWTMNPHAQVPSLKRQLELYSAELRALGKPFPQDLSLIRELYVAPDHRAAWAEARPYLDRKYAAYREWGQAEVLPPDDEWSTEFEELARDRFLIGDPEAILEGAQRCLAELPGVDHLVFRVQYPGMDQQKVLRAIRVLGEQVRPRLRLNR